MLLLSILIYSNLFKPVEDCRCMQLLRLGGIPPLIVKHLVVTYRNDRPCFTSIRGGCPKTGLKVRHVLASRID